MNHRPGQQYTKSYLGKLAYCLDCDRNLGMGEGWISGSIPSTLIEASLADNETCDARYNVQNGVRDGSTDPSLPHHLTHMGVQVDEEDS